MNFVKVSEKCPFYDDRFCLFIISVFKSGHWDDSDKCTKENCPFIYWIEKSNNPIQPIPKAGG